KSPVMTPASPRATGILIGALNAPLAEPNATETAPDVSPTATSAIPSRLKSAAAAKVGPEGMAIGSSGTNVICATAAPPCRSIAQATTNDVAQIPRLILVLPLGRAF